jgi:hypothetical protein
MLSQALLVFIIWVFAGGFITKKTPGNYIFLGGLGIILGIVFPPGLFFLYGMLGFWSVFDGIGIIFRSVRNSVLNVSQAKKLVFLWVKDSFFGRAIFILMTFPTMVYYSLLLSQYPWKRLVEFDVLHPTRFSYQEYALALGATLPLGLLGIGIWLLKRYNESRRQSIHGPDRKFGGFVVWIFAWGFFMIVFNFIPQQSPTRFTQMTPHVPLGILSIYGIYTMSQWIRQIFASKSDASGKQVLGVDLSRMIFTIPMVVVALGLGTMFSSWLWQKDFVDHKLRADIPLVPRGAEVMYPLLDLVEAMVWLQNNTPRSVAVLSGPATGNLIPVYAGNYTYVGHANTVNGEIKNIVSANFYGRKRPKEEFIPILKENNIQYILYGPEEAELAYGAFDLRVFYPYLSEVYRKGMVIVYKVNL